MKTLKTTLFISLTVFAQTAIKAQVTNAWDWVGNNLFQVFGTTGLTQNGSTGAGNYALLQAKAGSTYLNSPVEINFRINNLDKMTLLNNGYFGIGTTTPQSVVHIKSKDNATGSGLNLESYNGSSIWSILPEATSGSFGDRSLLFYNKTTSKYALSIGAGGKVGIGLVNPETALHIKMENNSTGSGLTLESYNASSRWSILAEATTGSYGDRSLLFYNKTTSKYVMSIGAGGNVGIGTMNPLNTLSVNGTVWAKAIKVSLTDAADWVFDDTYKLKPLYEVEAFIKTNKHLPDVPSADYFRKNDMNVAQMNNTLLQKIEELTLYIIEQNKRIEALEKNK